jgi:hypothetical protein
MMPSQSLARRDSAGRVSYSSMMPQMIGAWSDGPTRVDWREGERYAFC